MSSAAPTLRPVAHLRPVVAGVVALVAACSLAALPVSVAAQTPMTAEDFDAYVTGKTLTYSQYGYTFGTEEYLPGRKVRWAFTEDLCQYGHWYEEAGNICFVYEYDSTAHCWTFWQEGDVLKALSLEESPGAELSEVAKTDVPLGCPGPDVGV